MVNFQKFGYRFLNVEILGNCNNQKSLVVLTKAKRTKYKLTEVLSY